MQSSSTNNYTNPNVSDKDSFFAHLCPPMPQLPPTEKLRNLKLSAFGYPDLSQYANAISTEHNVSPSGTAITPSATPDHARGQEEGDEDEKGNDHVHDKAKIRSFQGILVPAFDPNNICPSDLSSESSSYASTLSIAPQTPQQEQLRQQQFDSLQPSPVVNEKSALHLDSPAHSAPPALLTVPFPSLSAASNKSDVSKRVTTNSVTPSAAASESHTPRQGEKRAVAEDSPVESRDEEEQTAIENNDDARDDSNNCTTDTNNNNGVMRNEEEDDHDEGEKQFVIEPQNFALVYGDESSSSPASPYVSRRLSQRTSLAATSRHAASSRRLSYDAGIQPEPDANESEMRRQRRMTRYSVSRPQTLIQDVEEENPVHQEEDSEEREETKADNQQLESGKTKSQSNTNPSRAQLQGQLVELREQHWPRRSLPPLPPRRSSSQSRHSGQLSDSAGFVVIGRTPGGAHICDRNNNDQTFLLIVDQEPFDSCHTAGCQASPETIRYEMQRAFAPPAGPREIGCQTGMDSFPTPYRSNNNAFSSASASESGASSYLMPRRVQENTDVTQNVASNDDVDCHQDGDAESNRVMESANLGFEHSAPVDDNESMQVTAILSQSNAKGVNDTGDMAMEDNTENSTATIEQAELHAAEELKRILGEDGTHAMDKETSYKTDDEGNQDTAANASSATVSHSEATSEAVRMSDQDKLDPASQLEELVESSVLAESTNAANSDMNVDEKAFEPMKPSSVASPSRQVLATPEKSFVSQDRNHTQEISPNITEAILAQRPSRHRQLKPVPFSADNQKSLQHLEFVTPLTARVSISPVERTETVNGAAELLEQMAKNENGDEVNELVANVEKDSEDLQKQMVETENREEAIKLTENVGIDSALVLESSAQASERESSYATGRNSESRRRRVSFSVVNASEHDPSTVNQRSETDTDSHNTFVAVAKSARVRCCSSCSVPLPIRADTPLTEKETEEPSVAENSAVGKSITGSESSKPSTVKATDEVSLGVEGSETSKPLTAKAADEISSGAGGSKLSKPSTIKAVDLSSSGIANSENGLVEASSSSKVPDSEEKEADNVDPVTPVAQSKSSCATDTDDSNARDDEKERRNRHNARNEKRASLASPGGQRSYKITPRTLGVMLETTSPGRRIISSMIQAVIRNLPAQLNEEALASASVSVARDLADGGCGEGGSELNTSGTTTTGRQSSGSRMSNGVPSPRSERVENEEHDKDSSDMVDNSVKSPVEDFNNVPVVQVEEPIDVEDPELVVCDPDVDVEVIPTNEPSIQEFGKIIVKPVDPERPTGEVSSTATDERVSKSSDEAKEDSPSVSKKPTSLKGGEKSKNSKVNPRKRRASPKLSLAQQEMNKWRRSSAAATSSDDNNCVIDIEDDGAVDFDDCAGDKFLGDGYAGLPTPIGISPRRQSVAPSAEAMERDEDSQSCAGTASQVENGTTSSFGGRNVIRRTSRRSQKKSVNQSAVASSPVASNDRSRVTEPITNGHNVKDNEANQDLADTNNSNVRDIVEEQVATVRQVQRRSTRLAQKNSNVSYSDAIIQPKKRNSLDIERTNSNRKLSGSSSLRQSKRNDDSNEHESEILRNVSCQPELRNDDDHDFVESSEIEMNNRRKSDGSKSTENTSKRRKASFNSKNISAGLNESGRQPNTKKELDSKNSGEEMKVNQNQSRVIDIINLDDEVDNIETIKQPQPRRISPRTRKCHQRCADGNSTVQGRNRRSTVVDNSYTPEKYRRSAPAAINTMSPTFSGLDDAPLPSRFEKRVEGDETVARKAEEINWEHGSVNDFEQAADEIVPEQADSSNEDNDNDSIGGGNSDNNHPEDNANDDYDNPSVEVEKGSVNENNVAEINGDNNTNRNQRARLSRELTKPMTDLDIQPSEQLQQSEEVENNSNADNSRSRRKGANKSRKRRRTENERGSKRPKKRKGVKEMRALGMIDGLYGRHGTAADEDEQDEGHNGVRRSRRQRFPVLKYWKNETVRYERRVSQSIPTVSQVVVDVAEDGTDDTWVAGRR